MDDFAVVDQSKRKPWNFGALHHACDGSVNLSRGAGTPLNPDEYRLGFRLKR